jgi:release factor glutamine methyltransferase
MRPVSPPASVGSLLRDATARLGAVGLPTARQDAEWLLAHVLDVERVALHRAPDRMLSVGAVLRYLSLVDRRGQEEPLQYLIGTEDFHGLRLRVTAAVLVPRPETEGLVSWATELLARDGGRCVADIGTGSGAIACALAAALPALSVVGIDRSLAALEVARENVRALGLAGRIRLVAGDLLEPLRTGSQVVDMLVSNPPYLPSSTIASLPREVACFEPRLALDGGPDGTRVLRRIVLGARSVLRPGGWLLLEIGENQAGALASLMAAEGFSAIEARRDFRDVERYIAGRLSDGPSAPPARAVWRGC